MIARLLARNLDAPGIVHGFFQRDGGASEGIYASLNCGPGSRDVPETVQENRRRVAGELGPGIELVTLYQVHSAIVRSVPLTAGSREGDAMVTATPGVALGLGSIAWLWTLTVPSWVSCAIAAGARMVAARAMLEAPRAFNRRVLVIGFINVPLLSTG